MRQTLIISLALFSLASLSLAIGGVQTPLVSNLDSTLFIESPSPNTYAAILYFGQESTEDACFSTQSEFKGLLFEDFTFDTFCLHLDETSNIVYFSAVSAEEMVTLYSLGDFVSSFRVIYDYSLEELYISRAMAGETSQNYRAYATNKISAIYVTAILTVKVDYSEVAFSDYSVYPFEATWAVEQGLSVEIASTIDLGATECMTPDFGILEGLEICADYLEDGYVQVYVDQVLIFESKESYSYDSLTMSYSNYDDLITFLDEQETKIFYISSLMVTYLLGEGKLITNMTGVITLNIDSIVFEKGHAHAYDCVTLKTSLMKQSVLYPSIEAMCMICDSNGDCEISALMEGDKTEPVYTTFKIETDSSVAMESVELVYYLNQDEITFRILTDKASAEGEPETMYSFRKYADEIITWSQDAGVLEYAAMFGTLSNDYTATESYSNILDIFIEIKSIQFTDVNVNYGVFCDATGCMIGTENDNEIGVVKNYKGTFDNVMVYRITDLGVDQVCVAFADLENYYEINDCNTEEQWLFYQEYVSRYPLRYEQTDIDELLSDAGVDVDVDVKVSAVSTKRNL